MVSSTFLVFDLFILGLWALTYLWMYAFAILNKGQEGKF